MTNKFRWPPVAALEELLRDGASIQNLFIAYTDKQDVSHVVACGMSELQAMRIALKFLLTDDWK